MLARLSKASHFAAMVSWRRIVLIGLATAAVAGNVALFATRTQDKPDLDLQITSAAIANPPRDRLPHFDTASQRWTLNGRPVTDLFDFAEYESRHYGRNFLTFTIDAGAGMRGLRRALVSLANQRICGVSVFDAGELRADPMADAASLVVTGVRDEAGIYHACDPRTDKAKAGDGR